MGIEPKSVNTHIWRIQKKLHVRSRVEILAVLYPHTPYYRELILSPRDKEILDFMAMGYSVKKISKILGVRETTIRRHKERMFLANDCKSTLELLSKYLQP